MIHNTGRTFGIMKSRQSVFVGIWAGIAVLIFTTACRPKKHTRLPGQKPVILATTSIIGDLLRQICQDKAEVLVLMGPGVDPHLYKVSQNDLGKFYEADLIVTNGLHLEGKMAETLHKLNGRKSIYTLAGVLSTTSLIKVGDGESSFDPHIWFDIHLWAATIPGLTTTLCRLAPESQKDFQQNASRLSTDLRLADSLMTQAIASIPNEKRLLITAHDAFSYFGRRYQIEVKGLQGISTMTDFGLADVRDLVTLIVARKIPAIFTETSVSARSISALIAGCESKGHPVKIGHSLYSDALGTGLEGTYLGMLKANGLSIVGSLGGDTTYFQSFPLPKGR